MRAAGRQLAHVLRRPVDGLHAVVQVERLAFARELLLEGDAHQVVFVFADVGADLVAAARRRLDDGDVADAGERHLQGPRDGRRRQAHHVDLHLEVAQQLLLAHAEALLLVHDHQPQIVRPHVGAEKPVGADEHVQLAGTELGEDAPLLGGGAEPRDHADLDGEVGVPLGERHGVLLGEDGRGHEDERLLARLRGLEGGAQGDLGLAVADVAADEAVHGVRRLHVVLDLVDGLGLVLGLLERERLLKAPRELAVRREGVARDRLAGGVELQQLAGHLDDGLAGARLDRLPVRAAELVERRGRAAGADVAADLADLVVRHEHAVLAAELQHQVVTGDAAHGARLDAGEACDAVVLVDDVVSGSHVEERGELRPCAGEALLARRARAAGRAR